ncbi:MAG: DNA mismatch repair protein MutS [Clostridia bacterium]|nr:DNA mismatch repair protein MutS [Clostridia bacterium]
MALSPMMQQYNEFKAQHPDCIVMMRLGDFYEMFFEDAKTASMELELVLTGKDCGLPERAPMCGVPHHALDQYLARLVAKGYRVAIVEQLEDPATAKGLVKRGVTRIVTPGTVFEGNFLREKENNYICCIHTCATGFGLAFADVSTGEVHATEILGGRAKELLVAETAAFAPREIVHAPTADMPFLTMLSDRYMALLTELAEADFEKENAYAAYKALYGEPNADYPYADIAVGALLRLLQNTQRTDLHYMQKPQYYEAETCLGIDSFSRRNLELCETLRSGERKGSLLWAVDRTRTAAGARLLKKWLEKPLTNCVAIKTRQEAVQALFDDSIAREELMSLLRSTVDIERLSTKLAYGTANARDLKALERTLKLIPQIREKLMYCKAKRLVDLFGRMDEMQAVADAIEKTISEEPALTVKEGGIIKPGCNAAVDELRMMLDDGKSWITKIEETERERTGIRTLKIGYNRVFGYYIEVSKSFMNQVPEDYIRRQTLTTGERFVTPELKEMESKVLGARERDCALEYELFCALRDFVLESLTPLQETARAIAELDVLCSFAEISREANYVCPEVDQSDCIVIKGGRHPVVERFLDGSYFVPNDCEMDCRGNRLLLITGPNMAGKSTYMRQVALITVLAQIGCFVPASEARIGVVDRIFTRIGASDDLASGNSTFMLEMNEVAEILKNATPRSLIIYDEIGRGTSTYDGMSIAKAVAEHTCKKIGAKALFATHYHELTDLEGSMDGVINYHIAAKKRGNDIIFLRKIVRGAADDSYGIEVAALAGVPNTVVNRAKAVLAELLESGVAPRSSKRDEDDGSISFEDLSALSVAEKLRSTDLNMLTPYEAMTLLFELKKML